MWRKRFNRASWLLVVFGLLFASGAGAQPTALDVRLGVHGDRTRFVLDLTEEPAYRAFVVPSPYRVVVDLPELEWSVPALERAGGLVSAVRYGLFTPGTSRIVLDLSRPAVFKQVFVIPPRDDKPYRLVVDIEPASADAASAQDVIESAKALPRPEPQVFEPKRDSRLTIVVDPGHGGVDPGAIGASGTYEKNVVLSYGQELKRQLEATGRYRVILTRDRDVFLQLSQRREVARKAGADLFISVHADAHGSNDLRGASVYTLSETASDAVAADLARRENKSDLIAGVDLESQSDDVSTILLDLTQRETMNLSARFAAMMVDELRRDVDVLRNTHRFAGFVVLKAHDVPSILVELGFLSNHKDERLLKSAAGRKKIAAAIVRGVDKYFSWQQTMR
jgi:N-acetylmuramoyl-L-alanine amidase